MLPTECVLLSVVVFPIGDLWAAFWGDERKWKLSTMDFCPASQTFWACAARMTFLLRRGVYVVIENPSTSLLWRYKSVRVSLHMLRHVTFIFKFFVGWIAIRSQLQLRL